jgi:hypothetical protein
MNGTERQYLLSTNRNALGGNSAGPRPEASFKRVGER